MVRTVSIILKFGFSRSHPFRRKTWGFPSSSGIPIESSLKQRRHSSRPEYSSCWNRLSVKRAVDALLTDHMVGAGSIFGVDCHVCVICTGPPRLLELRNVLSLFRKLEEL